MTNDKRIECEFKINRLFKHEKGKVSKNNRGSYIIGKCNDDLMYVNFGWNKRDEIFVTKNELKEIITFLTENSYEPYDSEDMIVYVNATEDKDYLQYRQELPGQVLTKDDAMKLL
jgi:hypothetical protein